MRGRLSDAPRRIRLVELTIAERRAEERRSGGGGVGEILRGAGEHNLAALGTGFGSDFENPVGGFKHVEIMLDYDNAVAAVDDALLVSDDELMAALHTYVASAHVLVELGSAAPLAGAWADRARIKGKRVVLVASGANVVPGHLARALKTPPLGAEAGR